MRLTEVEQLARVRAARTKALEQDFNTLNFKFNSLLLCHTASFSLCPHFLFSLPGKVGGHKNLLSGFSSWLLVDAHKMSVHCFALGYLGIHPEHLSVPTMATFGTTLQRDSSFCPQVPREDYSEP